MKNVTPNSSKKQCTECKETKCVSKFARNAKTVDGIRNKCKRCSNKTGGKGKATPYSRYDNIMKKLANNDFDVITELTIAIHAITEPALKAKLLLELMSFMYPKRTAAAGMAINDPGPEDATDVNNSIINLEKEDDDTLIKAIQYAKQSAQ